MQADSLVIDFEHPREDRAVLHLEGALARDTSLQLRDVVHLLFADGICEFVLNLTAVRTVDAAGVGALLDLTWLVCRHGGDMQLLGLERAAIHEPDAPPPAASAIPTASPAAASHVVGSAHPSARSSP